MRQKFWKFVFSFFTPEQLQKLVAWVDQIEEKYQEEKRLKKSR